MSGKKPTTSVGDIINTKYGACTVVYYKTSEDVIVEFNDGTRVHSQAVHLRSGNVKNPNTPEVYGVGFIGVGEFKASTRHGVVREYDVWRGMLRRCYDLEYQARHTPTYAGCTVDKAWHNYQMFAKDYVVLSKGKEDWHLDKDLALKGNKIYSNDTCIMLPPELNSLLTNAKANRGKYPQGVSYSKSNKKFGAWLQNNGPESLGFYDKPEEAFAVYKKAKESFVKTQANKWREQIDPRAYEALMNYQVEITD